ncbi:MAG TPA: coiled coil domain-containing protein [Acidobacteriota bacterium]|jgi:hypothetical protein
MEQRINELAAKIERLLEKTESKVRGQYKKQAQDLPRHVQTAREKLRELSTASAGAWEEMKPGLEKAWTELKTSFDQAATRFKAERKR